MAITNKERVGRGLEQLRKGLQPVVLRELQVRLGKDWKDKVQGNSPAVKKAVVGEHEWDAYTLLTVMKGNWTLVFGKTLSQEHRNLVHESLGIRNKWAHDETLTYDHVYRGLSGMRMLLEAVSAGEEAREVLGYENEVLRVKFTEQTRRVTRQAALEFAGTPQEGLRPWREVVTPHADVSSGGYRQAEFAADLAQVHRGEASAEYGDPEEFFRRTYITEGLDTLLVNALKRLSGQPADPVVGLQTNFGGGKTHSMLAAYHLGQGVPAAKLLGVDELLKKAGVSEVPKARRAVIVGTALAPGQSREKDDGTEVRTLWGEIAWQLGKAEGFALVAEADRTGTSPGSEVLVELFRKYSPCLILIDEWVAYVRQTYEASGLPAGSFDANLTFAQSLTEAAKAVDGCLVIGSLPQSELEVGGEGGRKALEKLEHTFGRVEANWRPATAEEGFEIVRRRLFMAVDPEKFALKDAVVQTFSKMYRDHASEFPQGCGEADYRERMQKAYPIHPDLFDHLYGTWSTLDRFQRTRGVLRLMAVVIHELWERSDSNLMILPAMVPVNDAAVTGELRQYLEDSWDGVLDSDVDGPNSVALKLDRELASTLGRFSAARRVARSLFLGTAPTARASTHGIDVRQVKLACAQPGEAVAVFGDALRYLSDRAMYLNSDGQRYWFDTSPTVARIARQRAADLDADVVDDTIVDWLRKDRARGVFPRVHVVPGSSADVPDEMEAGLVVLGPAQTHAKGNGSKARAASEEILTRRGNAPRLYRNTLVFLAPQDGTRIQEVRDAVRLWLAWSSIVQSAGADGLNLTPHSLAQAKRKVEEYESSIRLRIPETWMWALVPSQLDPGGPIVWVETKIQGDPPLAERTAKRLVRDEHLLDRLGAVRLRMELDKHLWKDGPHIEIRKLRDYLCSYPYLPRVKDVEVLYGAVRDAFTGSLFNETFAYAEGYDQDTGRYRGIRTSGTFAITLDGMLVKPEVAAEQIDVIVPPDGDGGTVYPPPGPHGGPAGPAPPAGDRPVRRFHASAELDPDRIGRDAGQIAEEVLQHLTVLPGARVQVHVEISAELPDGVPDDVRRTVSENCNALRFTSHGFEKE